MARLLWACPLLIAGVAHAANFDCKGIMPQNKAICTSPSLIAADDRMAVAYKAAQSATPADMAPRVKADQTAWQSNVYLLCPIKKGAEEMATCLAGALDDRTKQLQALIIKRQAVTFVMRSALLKSADQDGAEQNNESMPGYGSIAITWPQAAGDDAQWLAWNYAIEQAIGQLAPNEAGRQVPLDESGNVLKRLEADPASAVWKDEWADGLNGEVKVTLGVMNPQLVTAFIDVWWWGGAHPAEDSMQLNWMLQERRELRVGDVFRAGSGWEGFLTSQCTEGLKRELTVDESYDPVRIREALPGVVKQPRNWRLDTRGISVVFQDYAVAPRLLHPAPILIPWPTLKPYLNPAFALARVR